MSRLDSVAACNESRLDPKGQGGQYESYFLRANHPSRPLAFWIRYTALVPRGRPGDAVGERWAIYFDGESGRHVATKDVVPMSACDFSGAAGLARIGDARLTANTAHGSARGDDGEISWALRYAGDAAPLRLLADRLYEGGFPKAKALVSLPLARFEGALRVDGAEVDVGGWVGSQNHNWGARHTDAYAWGQVAGFDDDPQAFLEVSTARVRVGPLWTPPMTPLVLRHGGVQYAFNTIARAARNRGHYGYFEWTFAAAQDGVRISGRLQAPKSDFVALRYDNPPGGYKTCLNSKLAAASVALQRPGRPMVTLSTAHRAAFEILTDDDGHGLSLRV